MSCREDEAEGMLILLAKRLGTEHFGKLERWPVGNVGMLECGCHASPLRSGKSIAALRPATQDK